MVVGNRFSPLPYLLYILLLVGWRVMHKTILLTGVPRSGSSLLCNLLNHYENTLALLEPINQFPDSNTGMLEVCQYIAKLSFQYRNDVLSSSKVLSMHSGGCIPTNTLSDKFDDCLRGSVVEYGVIDVDSKLTEDFCLVIKQNAFFTSILKYLRCFFPCYGVVRNPLSVLCSWATVDIPVNVGQIPEGERFDIKLRERLNRAVDNLDRQLIILNWFFEKFDRYLAPENIIKYENTILANGVNLADLSYNGILEEGRIKLSSRNVNKLYRDIDIDKIYRRLVDNDGFFWLFYDRQDIDKVYSEMKIAFNK